MKLYDKLIRNPNFVGPKFKFLGKTWVGWLNIFLIQWLFIRIAYGTNWTIIGFIVPCSGWWNDYKFLGKKWQKNLIWVIKMEEE